MGGCGDDVVLRLGVRRGLLAEGFSQRRRERSVFFLAEILNDYLLR